MRNVIALVALAAVLLAPIAAAHSTTYTSDNKIKIVYGFTNEPAVTYTKNGLDLILSDNATGVPITGADKTLTKVELIYADKTYNLSDFKAAFGKPGSYTGVVTPSKPGQYKLHLVGAINGTALDMTINPAHDVEGYTETLFPAADGPEQVDAKLAAMQTKLDAQQAKIDALDAKVKAQAETPATTTPQKAVPGFEVGLLALAAVGAVLALRRRN